MFYRMMRYDMGQLFMKWYWKRFVAVFLCIGIGLFIGIVLFYYSPEDWSCLYYRGDDFVAHPFGRIGAHCAALSTYLFGGASLIFVVVLFLLSYIFALHRSFVQELDRISCVFLLLFVSAALLYGYSSDPLHSPCPGGYCGVKVWKLFAYFFDSSAAALILFGFLLMASIVIIRFPFIATFYYSTMIAQFLYTKRYILKPIYYGSKFVIYYTVYPIIFAYHYINRVFTGAVVTKADESIVSFEHDDEGVINDIIGDEFWRTYRNESTIKEGFEPVSFSTLPKDGEEDDGQRGVDTKINLAMQQQIKQQYENKTESSKNRYHLPQLDIFINQRDIQEDVQLMNELEARARILEEKLEHFGVCGKVTAIKRGPVVTLFEYQPHIDTKLSKIVALEDDLAMALQALSIRIIAPIPGRSVVGFEVANSTRKKVMLGSIIQSKSFRSYLGALPLILGCDTSGNDVIVDLAKMPHLLIAGSTGSGKSVALNSMLVSLLCQCTPNELRLILIDPKRLEFASYEDIAHLLFPIITDPKQAILALRWIVKEMEKRYEQMKHLAARNIFDYNAAAGKESCEKLPFIVIVIDELSDLMITAGRDIEDLIVRITQMARAAGIHMLVATQRPSVDVITGLIKVNFPSRISFRVTSKVDSRTILDCSGAEKLLGRGDMLFIDAGSSALKRVHGAYVSDGEIENLVSYIRGQAKPEYCELPEKFAGSVDLLEGDDQLYHDVIAFIEGVDEVSISLLQRRFRIGYNRSARIIEMLEIEGLIAPSEGGKIRKVIRR
ncbi:DNA translocase FtsK [Candidatus Dependentiae bacterium]|nr:MAG: DNA translocase FtsK [Candidatus Dependentiae bacterium]